MRISLKIKIRRTKKFNGCRKNSLNGSQNFYKIQFRLTNCSRTTSHTISISASTTTKLLLSKLKLTKNNLFWSLVKNLIFQLTGSTLITKLVSKKKKWYFKLERTFASRKNFSALKKKICFASSQRTMLTASMNLIHFKRTKKLKHLSL